MQCLPGLLGVFSEGAGHSMFSGLNASGKAVRHLAAMRHMLDVDHAPGGACRFPATHAVLVECKINQENFDRMVEELLWSKPPARGGAASLSRCWFGDRAANGVTAMRLGIFESQHGPEGMQSLKEMQEALRNREYAKALAVCHVLDLPGDAASTRKMRRLTAQVLLP
jgi:hypothetical protein